MIRDSLIRNPRRGLLTQVLIAVGLCPHRNISFPQSPLGSKGKHATVQCHDCHRRFEYSWSAMKITKGEISTPARP